MDKQVIEQKLESLRRCLSRLRSHCPEDVNRLLQDVDMQDIVALNLTRAVQLCVDIALHWLSDYPELPAPSTMGQAFDALNVAGLLDRDIVMHLKKAVGFRNLAVHSYEAINWHIVHAICKTRLDDFDHFAAKVHACL